MLRKIFLLVAVVLATGCTIIPEDIRVPDDTNLVSYNKAVTGGDGVKGKMARWGGVIVGVENKENKTWVEVVNFPLNHYGRPNTFEETIGRFKVELDGFVDPINFEEGRSVTFIGAVERPVAGMVGEQPYMYPRIKCENFHMWRQDSLNYVHPMFFDYRMGWYSPFYYSFYRPYYSPYTFGVGFSRGYYRSAYPNVSPVRVSVTRSGNKGTVSRPSTSTRSSVSRPVTRTSTPANGGARQNLK